MPTIAGLGGESFYDPATMVHGFRVAMVACAVLAAAGGALAWLTIRSDLLEAAADEDGEPTPVPCHYSCGVAGSPLRPRGEATRQA